MTMADGDSRMAIVDQAIRRFVDRERFPVRADARAYLGHETLVDQETFTSALAGGKFDISVVEKAFDRTLDSALRKARLLQRPAIDRKVAIDAAHEVIEREMKCMFPFILC